MFQAVLESGWGTECSAAAGDAGGAASTAARRARYSERCAPACGCERPGPTAAGDRMWTTTGRA